MRYFLMCSFFQGNAAEFSSAIYSDLRDAELYIKKYSLSGCLTKMPLNISLYEWAIDSGFFLPKNELQKSPKFIQRFTSAYTEHYHYLNGNKR